MTGPSGDQTGPSGDFGGPPLGSLFSITGRPAPGLYAGAWLFTFLGTGFIAVALAASVSGNGAGAGWLAAVGFASFFLAALLGSGYQTLVRRTTRDPQRYRGPSPFLVFAAIFAGANAIGAIVALSGIDALVTAETRVLLSVAIVVPLYALLVWVLVVREGALDWRAMGWPTRPGTSARALADLAYGVATTVPIVLLTTLVALVLVALFQVTPPALLPIPRTPAEWAVDIVVAVILAPVGEELFFRGFAQTAWTRDLGWRAALLRTAIFFALVHAISIGGTDFSEGLRIAVVAIVARLPVAFGLGWVFARTGSIAASIGLHAGFNGLMLVLAAFAVTR